MTVAQRRKIVGGLPPPRIGLDPQIVEPFLEGFEMRIAVAIVVVTDRVEVPETSVDRQVAPPLIPVAREGDAFARLHVGHAIGPAAEQRLEAGIFECRRIDGVFCQYRHEADDERLFAIVGTG
jgi:hypothetical protein